MAEMEPAFLYYETSVAHDVALLDTLTQGCYLKLLQHYRRYRGFTPVLLRYILGNDYDHAWQSLQFVLEYDEADAKYHIAWLRGAIAERQAFNEKQDKTSENQRERVKKRWAKVKEEKAQTAGIGNTAEEPPQTAGNTTVIPRYNDGITHEDTQSILFNNTNTITNTNSVGEEGGKGEDEEGVGDEPAGQPPWTEGDWSHLPQHATPLASAMVDEFVAQFPKYLRDDAKDCAACLQIAYDITQQQDWPWQSALNGRMQDVLGVWREIVAWIATSSWYRTKALWFIAKDFQGVIQAKNNGTSETTGTRVAKLGTGEAQLAAIRNFGLG